MKIFFALALFAVAASSVYSQVCHMREIDLCTAMGMFHYQSHGVPSDEEKVNEWCETMKEVRDCMTNYTNTCTSPMQREMLSLLSGSETDAQELCVEGSDIRARYLKHAECLSEGAETDEFRGYIRDVQVIVEKLFEVPFKQRFPLLCCGLRRFCHSLDLMTEKRCGKPAVEMVRKMIHMVASNLPETICKPYDPESQQCQAVLPAPGTPSTAGANKSQLSRMLDTVFGEAK